MPECVYVHTMCVQEPLEVRRTESSLWVLGTRPRFSPRAGDAHRDTKSSLQPAFHFYPGPDRGDQLDDDIFKTFTNKELSCVAQLAGCLPNTYEAPGSNPSNT